MAKRYISLLLFLALLPACLAVPVMAEETTEDYFFDLLDYTSPDGSGRNTVNILDDTLVGFSLPSRMPLRNIDIIIYSPAVISSVTAYINGASSVLSVLSLGDNVYRIYGEFGENWTTFINLDFDFSGYSSSYSVFYSFRLSSSVYDTYSTPVYGVGTALGQTSQSLSVSYPDGPTYDSWSYSSFDDYTYAGVHGQFSMQFVFSDWRKYDFLDLQLAFICDSITSVSAYLGNDVLPLSVNHIDKGVYAGQYLVFVTVDLSEVPRTVDNNPTIIVAGSGDYECLNQVTIRYASGSFLSNNPSDLSLFFSQLHKWFLDQTNSINGTLVNIRSLIQGYIADQTTAITNSLSSIGTSISTFSTNVGTWFTNQTNSINGTLVAVRALIQGYIEDQTTAITNSLSTINSSIGTFRTNVGTWFTNQTTAITNSISSWGQSLKDSIDALPKKIAEELKALIVPADGAVESMASKSEALVSDRFGGVFEGAQIVDNWAGQLQSQAATQILTIPVVNMNILGSNFPIGGWEVDLIPDGFEIIFESVKIIIDILATAAFVNGIKNRLERTLER